MPAGAPYLSVIAAADDGREPRAQAFVDSWCQLARLHALSLEAIVAPTRNAAIRRARGEFILATHLADIASPELMQFLASESLAHHRLYRADRYDGALRVWAREGLFPLASGGLRANTPPDISSPTSAIHFESGWFPPDFLSGHTGRFFGSDAVVVFPRHERHWAALDLEVEPGPGIGSPPAALQVIDWHGDIAAEWEILQRTALRLWIPPAPKATTRQILLRTPKGGWPSPDNLHIRNFRCFHFDWVEPRAAAPRLSLPDVLRERRPTLARYLPAARERGAAAMLRTPLEARRVLRLLGSIGADVFGEAIEY